MMNADLAFLLLNASVLPAWALLIFKPAWPRGREVIAPVVVPAMLAVVYVALLGPSLLSGEGDMGSLDGLRRAFERDEVLLGAWVHYLAFDLVVGAWEARDAHRRGLKHAALVPCLLLTLFLGPSGLLTYLCVRALLAPRKGQAPQAGARADAPSPGTGSAP